VVNDADGRANRALFRVVGEGDGLGAVFVVFGVAGKEGGDGKNADFGKFGGAFIADAVYIADRSF
jgi:hypothetical protein